MRWLTVNFPDQPDHQLLLEKPGPPACDDATAEQIRDLVTKGAMGVAAIIAVDDVRKTYEELIAEALSSPRSRPSATMEPTAACVTRSATTSGSERPSKPPSRSQIRPSEPPWVPWSSSARVRDEQGVDDRVARRCEVASAGRRGVRDHRTRQPTSRSSPWTIAYTGRARRGWKTTDIVSPSDRASSWGRRRKLTAVREPSEAAKTAS